MYTGCNPWGQTDKALVRFDDGTLVCVPSWLLRKVSQQA
jgi:hypothetical protein